ncbi:MAG: hypothetical protein IPO81_30720 [Kouleothrix sp.]|nr:hypothetical protein [Kouleothrix sp.]
MHRRPRSARWTALARLLLSLVLLAQSANVSASPRPAARVPATTAAERESAPVAPANPCEPLGCTTFLPLVRGWHDGPTPPPPDTTPPTTPAGLRAIGTSDTAAELAWDAASDDVGVAFYELYQGATLALTTTATVVVAGGLAPETSYIFTVAARDAAGNRSVASEPLGVITHAPPGPLPDTTPPSAPAGLRATGRTTSTIGLAWDASTDDVGVSAYDLYAGDALLRSTAATTATLGQLSPGAAYALTVRARDAAGNSSAPSDVLAVSTMPVPRPGDDAYEPDDRAEDAGPIGDGETQRHTFSVAGDQDWARFDAVAGASYRVETSGLAPGVDTLLELYASDGAALLASDDDGNGGRASRIEHTFDRAGAAFVRARAYSPNAGSPDDAYDLTLTLLGISDREPPAAPAGLRLLAVSHSSASLSWDAASDDVGVARYEVYDGDALAGATVAPVLRLAGLVPATTHPLRVYAFDAAGNRSAPSAALDLTTLLPPDPATIATPIDRTVVSDIAADTTFLYSGDDAPQVGVTAGTIDPARVAVLRGRVIDRDGAALPGVHVRVLSHPEYGVTASRADGVFDLAVNGGGTLTVSYERDGYLPAQRQVDARWRDYAWLPEVALIAPDPVVTTIALGSAAGLQVAAGSRVSDADGERQALLIFPAQLTATLELASGERRPIDTLHVRATEYTVGKRGPQAMPGELPPSSGYTYAVEYSVDEALAVGARHVRFSRPVAAYVDNFLGFPVGSAVPAGYYDRARAAWVASDNGQVIAIVGLSDGMAELDLDGDGAADDPATLAIADDERAALAQRYDVGHQLWRVPVTHFSPWDFNWPFGAPRDAIAPNGEPPRVDQPLDDPCTRGGSIIECQNQTLGEEIPIVGSSFRLRYSSGRAVGHTAASTLRIPLSGAQLPASLKRIELAIEVAGQHFEQSFPSLPSQQYSFTWDRTDAYGRALQGQQPITARVGFVYDAIYQAPARFGDNGGGVYLEDSRARQEVISWQTWDAAAGTFDALDRGLGGWSFDAHHTYDPGAKAVYLGDGGRQSADLIGPVVDAVSSGINLGGLAVGPDGAIYFADRGAQVIWRADGPSRTIVAGQYGLSGLGGDGGPATGARMNGPADVALGPDGSLYIADYWNHRVRRVAPDGTIDTIAGGSIYHAAPANGTPATEAYLAAPSGVAAGRDGSVYIADGPADVVYRVGTDGLISRIAGSGWRGFAGDGGPAGQARLNSPLDVAVAPDGSLYVADAENNRIRRVGVDGIITTVAGSGPVGQSNGQSSGDGSLATSARLNGPTGVAVAPDGSLYVADYRRARWVGPDGIIGTIATNPTNTGFPGDGSPAATTGLSDLRGMAAGPDGSLYLSVQYYRTPYILRVRSAMPGFQTQQVAVPSADGSQIFQFDAAGRHLYTLDALTLTIVNWFNYDAAGRLEVISDRNGLSTQIERDAAGRPTAIVAPYGQRTALGLDAAGRIAAATNPAGETTRFGYTNGGLLASLTDPRGGTHSFSYDELGRLVEDRNPVGGLTALARVDHTRGYTVTLTNALGDSTALGVEQLPAGGQRRISVAANGAVSTSETRPDGSQVSVDALGNVTTVIQSPDPRWGMQVPFASSISMRTAAGQTYFTRMATRGITLYNPANRLTLRTQNDTVTTNGRVSTTSYDAPTRTIATTDSAGLRTIRRLDWCVRLVFEQTANLAPRQYEYDEQGHLTRVVEGSGAGARATTMEYGAAGLLARVTDPLGGTTSFSYDAAGRAIGQRLPSGHLLSSGYDASGNRTSSTDAQGLQTTYEYDAQNRLVAATLDPGGRAVRTAYQYDAADNLLARIDDAGAGRLNATTRYSYTPATGSQYAVASVTDPLGQQTSMTYTLGGALHSATDPLGHTTVMTYTAQGWLTEVRTPGGRITRTSYDGEGRPVAVSDPRGVTTTSSYDAAGRLRQVVAGATAVGEQPALNQSTTYDYDQNSRIVRVTDALGSSGSFSYDGFGRTVAGSDPLGNTTTFAYDALDRLTLETRGANVPGEATQTAYSYDAAGRPLAARVDPDGLNLLTQYRYSRAGGADGWNVQEVVDPRGGVTGFHYNSLGQRDRTIDALGQTWQFDYDNLGRLVHQFDPQGHATSIAVDALGRPVSLTEGGRTQRWSYSADGTTASATDFAGRTTGYAYDVDGQLTGIDYPAGTPDTSYSYDAAGNLVAMSDGLGGTEYAYDALNRLVARTRGGLTVGYSYDGAGRTSTIDYWGQGAVAYGYDAVGRLTSVDPWGAGATGYAYRAGGQLAGITRDSGVSTSYDYDSAGRLIGILHALGATNIETIAYALDANGNRARVTDGDGVTSYGYDALNRLVAADYPTSPDDPPSTPRYTLDPAGNRLSDGARSYSYDAAGRISSPGYSYDANGNLLSDGAASYEYDAANRLIKSVRGGITTSYGYDGNGNLVRETVGDVTSDLLLDERGPLPTILGEVRSDGSEIRYAYGPEGVTAQQTSVGASQSIAYPLLDGQGSLRRLTDAGGAVTLSRSYDAFGVVRRTSGGGWTTLGYTGERTSAADGTVYLRARHYSPALGRFLQRDSYAGTPGRPQSLNRYAYAENNPATYTDPSGRCPFCVAAAVGAVVGAGIEYGTQVYQNYQGGKTGWDAFSSVRGDRIAMAAVQGAVAGGVGFVAGPLVGALTRTGLAGSVLAGALEGSIGNGLGQIAVNLLRGCEWNSGLTQALLSGGLSGGIGGGLGWAARQARAVIFGKSSNNIKGVALNAVEKRDIDFQPPVVEVTENTALVSAERTAKDLPEISEQDAIKKVAQQRLDYLRAKYGPDIPIDKAVQLRITLGKVGTDVESVRSALIGELEHQLAVQSRMYAPVHKLIQIEELQSDGFNMDRFITEWDMHIDI